MKNCESSNIQMRIKIDFQIHSTMKWSSTCLTILVWISLLEFNLGAITITAHQNVNPKLMSIDESIIYKALTVIEGDILVDKFCECQLERLCQAQKRNIIELTQLVF